MAAPNPESNPWATFFGPGWRKRLERELDAECPGRGPGRYPDKTVVHDGVAYEVVIRRIHNRRICKDASTDPPEYAMKFEVEGSVNGGNVGFAFTYSCDKFPGPPIEEVRMMLIGTGGFLKSSSDN